MTTPELVMQVAQAIRDYRITASEFQGIMSTLTNIAAGILTAGAVGMLVGAVGEKFARETAFEVREVAGVPLPVPEYHSFSQEKKFRTVPPRVRAEEFIYIPRELESTFDELMVKLPLKEQRRVGQLFEILEDTNHLRRAIQEQRVPLEPFQLLEMELRIAYELGYITRANLNLYQTAVLGIEDLMIKGQFSAASGELNKLETGVAKHIIRDFDIPTKTAILKIVESMREATAKKGA